MVNVNAAFKAGGVEVLALCDVDSAHLEKSAADIEKLQGSRPKTFKLYEDMLTTPGLEAVIIGTQPHWHALQLFACVQRGLDVYCEKPLAYDIREGRAMVDAVAKSGRIVQIGRNLSDVMKFRVVGAADFGFYGNNNTVMIGLPAAQGLFGDDETGVVNAAQDVHLRLRVTDVFNAGVIAQDALNVLPAQLASDQLVASSWSESQSSLFDALRLEKTLTGFMLLMIVVIGAVNIVSTLVMVVADKSADIAILRTMGASRATIMMVFVTQGTTVGIFGTALGAVLGVLLSLNLSRVMQGIESTLNAAFSPDDVYMISYLRAELRADDVVLICISALAVSFLATLYPAYRATRIQPAEVLRYE
jgi:ABC-type lipoprotein release transport system permease subunit